TRTLLTERAAADDDGAVRRATLQALVQDWPDEQTRTLLTERAAADNDGAVRQAAMDALAWGWPSPDNS
ncbi:MAG TPA: HEAT repeat domain-containing protein, partial [Sporichthyaceae bacterium]